MAVRPLFTLLFALLLVTITSSREFCPRNWAERGSSVAVFLHFGRHGLFRSCATHCCRDGDRGRFFCCEDERFRFAPDREVWDGDGILGVVVMTLAACLTIAIIKCCKCMRARKQASERNKNRRRQPPNRAESTTITDHTEEVIAAVANIPTISHSTNPTVPQNMTLQPPPYISTPPAYSSRRPSLASLQNNIPGPDVSATSPSQPPTTTVTFSPDQGHPEGQGHLEGQGQGQHSLALAPVHGPSGRVGPMIQSITLAVDLSCGPPIYREVESPRSRSNEAVDREHEDERRGSRLGIEWGDMRSVSPPPPYSVHETFGDSAENSTGREVRVEIESDVAAESNVMQTSGTDGQNGTETGSQARNGTETGSTSQNGTETGSTSQNDTETGSTSQNGTETETRNETPIGNNVEPTEDTEPDTELPESARHNPSDENNGTQTERYELQIARDELQTESALTLNPHPNASGLTSINLTSSRNVSTPEQNTTVPLVHNVQHASHEQVNIVPNAIVPSPNASDVIIQMAQNVAETEGANSSQTNLSMVNHSDVRTQEFTTVISCV